MVELIVIFITMLPNGNTATEQITEQLSKYVTMSVCKTAIIENRIEKNPDTEFRRMISIRCEETIEA